MNASVTGSALNQIPLVNSTQILTASAQAPMTSVVATTPVVTASTPIMTSTPITTSTTPVVATTTPIMTASTPIVAGSTPVMGSVAGAPVSVAQPVVTSAVQTPQGYGTSNFATTVYSAPVVDDDYRLGRGILDDFRPRPYQTQIASLGSTTGLATTGLATTGLATTGLATTVTTPANVGASSINDFL